MSTTSLPEQVQARKLELLAQRLKQKGIGTPAAAPIRAQSPAASALSFAQQRLWFLDQLTPGQATYTIPAAVRLCGPLDPAALEAALNAVVQRHAILRTSFTIVQEQPIQTVLAERPVVLARLDMQTVAGQAQTEAVRELLNAQARQPFDLARDALVRGSLVRLGPHEHLLLLCVHHIVSDGWSMGVLVREIAALYAAAQTGLPAKLAPLPLQYADYAAWQRDWLCGPVLEEQLAYWREQLGPRATAELPILELPADRPRPTVQTYRGAKHSFVLSEQTTAGLKTLSRDQGVTLFMTLLAAFDVLLYRSTGQTDLLVGTPIANRSRSELEGLIGFFVNSLVLRADLADDPPFSALLARVRDVCLEAYRHQDIPFEKLVEALQPQRDLSHTPLFQVMFVLDNTPMPSLKQAGLSMHLVDVDSGTAKFDLLLELREQAGALRGWFEYNTDLFDPATIAALATHFQVLLKQLLVDPERAVSAIPLLLGVERHQMLVGLNSTALPTAAACVHELVQRQALHSPAAIALRCGTTELTYQELERKANQLAHRLRQLGVGPDVPVAVCMQPSIEMMVSVLGILKAGGVYLALDPAYPHERLSFMLDDARAPVLLTQPALRDRLPGIAGAVLCLDPALEAISAAATTALPAQASLDDLVYVVYTSGSTGTPKGVTLSHGALSNLLLWQLDAFSPPQAARTLQFSALSFDVSFQEIFATWCAGGTLVIVDNEQRRDPRQLLEALDHHQIERLFLPFVALQQLAEAVDATGRVPRALREVITAGEQLQITRPIARMFGALPACVLRNQYGPSESHVVSAFTLAGDPDAWPALPPIGRPIANSQLYVLDARMEPVPIGVTGELYIGGANLARGYLHRPAVTADRFLPHPFSQAAGARLYRTGDLARYRSDGTIQFLGRSDHQVKIRGFRIELGEIEATLLQHPAVQVAAVVAQAQGGAPALQCYVVLRDGCALATHELRAFLQQRLPDYMLPAGIHQLAALPLTPSGKVNRSALPAGERERPELATSYSAPRTPLEQTLAAIWADVLGLPAVGIDDNFFELGGHSLAATRLMYRIQQAFGVDVPLRRVFDMPTVAGFSMVLDAALTSAPAAAASTLDLAAEARLDPLIRPPAVAAVPVAQARHILLTGATGFVGAFLLAELLRETEAEISCLVRAADLEQGRRRIQTALETYELWNPAWAARILPVLGDLAQPGLGLEPAVFQQLADELDVIYHNGALVNYIYPYAVLKAPNVLGTQEVLRLATTTRTKSVHFISTTGVLDPTGLLPGACVSEDAPLSAWSGLMLGYAQSKWVAEQLIALAGQRGVPVATYRLGRIAGHSHTGACQTDDFVWRMIKTCIQLGRSPELDLPLHLTPVDYAAQSVVYLSQQTMPNGRVFHVTNQTSLGWTQVVRWMQDAGYPLVPTPLDAWRTAVLEAAEQRSDLAGYGLMSLLSGGNLDPARLSIQLDDHNTVAGLAGSSLRCPPVDATLLSTYFGYYIRHGFLVAPPRP